MATRAASLIKQKKHAINDLVMVTIIKQAVVDDIIAALF